MTRRRSWTSLLSSSLVALADVYLTTLVALLIDTAPRRTDITTLCGLPGNQDVTTTKDYTTALSSILQSGPAGLTVLPVSWPSSDQPPAQSTSQRNHLSQYLGQLQGEYDLLIADVGNQATNLASRLRATADELVMVTT